MYGSQTSSVSYRYFNTRTQDGAVPILDQGTSRATFVNERYGSENPHWRQAILSGGDATTSFTGIKRTRKRVAVMGSATLLGPASAPIKPISCSMSEDDRGNFTAVFPDSTELANADRLARKQFIMAYRARRTAFQGGVFLGEMMETVRMIANPAKALREGIGAYHRDVKKRLRRSDPRKKRRIVHDTWLEYAFGWSPLIGDIKDACKLATANPIRYREPIKSFTNTQWKQVFPDYGTQPLGSIGFPFIRRRDWYENTCYVRYLGAVDAENSPPGFPEQLGFSWSNFLPTVWELIPYSFLVDYFSNVGDVVAGVATGTVNLAWGCKTTRRICAAHSTVQLDSAAMDQTLGKNRWRGTAFGSGEVANYAWVERAPVNGVSFGLKDLTIGIPAFQSKKWLNIGALFTLRN